MAVAVAPLRNLTGDPEQQFLVDGFTDRLESETEKGSSSARRP
jgi:TolB-like protein